MKTIRSRALGLLALTLLALPSHAQIIAVPVGNFSFESPVITSVPHYSSGSSAVFYAPGANTGGLNGAAVPDWTFAGKYGGLAEIGSMTGANGSQDAFFNNVPGGGTSALTYSGVGAAALPTIAANTSYTLTVALGNVSAAVSSTPGSFTLNLLAGSSPVIVATSGTILQSSISQGTYQDFSVILTSAQSNALVGQQLGIQLVAGADTTPGSTFNEEVFDNVRLTANTVDEPSTYAAILAGMALLAFCIRRQGVRLKA